MVALFRDSRSPFWYYEIADKTAPRGRRRVSTKRTKKAEAAQVAAAVQKDILDRDQLGVLEEVTLAVALDRYVAAAGRKADAENIASKARKIVGRLEGGKGRFFLPPTMLLHTLTTRHLDRLREARRQEGNAEQTINHELRCLSAAHNYMKRLGVRVAPNLHFDMVRVPGKLRWLTVEEEARLLHELHPDTVVSRQRLNRRQLQQRQDAYDLVVFLLDTGCRYSEVGTMPWSAIDTVGWHWIDIYRTKTGQADMSTMTDRLRVVLSRRYNMRSNSLYVFPGYKQDDQDDAPRGKATIAIRKAIKRAGLNTPELVKRFGTATTHTLRDTYASRLVQAGVSLYKVQKLLGHSSPTMTAKYAKLEPRGVADEAAAVLNSLRV